MSRQEKIWRLRPVSINMLGAIIALVFLILLGGYGWFSLNEVSLINDKMRHRNILQAEEELASTLNRVVEVAAKITESYAQWDETIQQFHNPIYYNYWRDTRAREANFVPQYVSNLELYDNSGSPLLEKINFNLIPLVDDKKLGAYIAKLNNKFRLYYITEISDSRSSDGRLGYVAVEFNLLYLIDEVQKFRQLDYSSLVIDMKNNTILPVLSSYKFVSYSIISQPEFRALSKLVHKTLSYLGVGAVLFFLLLMYVLFTLIAKPLMHLSKHIDDLSAGKLAPILSNIAGMGLISEFSKLRVSLNYYIEQLEKLDNVASGDLQTITTLEYGKNVTGIMLSFNNVLKKLQQTMEEKDMVTLELTKQADMLQKVNEEAMSASKAKSSFLANTSHEIRTPLTSIIGFAEICLDADIDMTEKTGAIQSIIASGKHLQQIINDILDLSKVEANKLQIDKVPDVSPFQIVYDIDTLSRMSAKEKGLQFEYLFQLPLPKVFSTDPIRLKQIIINLCNNAIKFTSSGLVQTKVHYDYRQKCIKFSVKDTGIGLSEQQTSKIFEPFTQADESTTRNYGGTGLGLTLSRQLAKMLGGELTVESIKDVGSIFSVSIPIDDASNVNFIEDARLIPELNRQQSSTVTQHQLRGQILVAEDTLEIQHLLAVFFKRWGINAHMVSNGKQAIEAIQNSHFDLVLMDLQMPVMGGIEAVKILREQSFRQPIVALTANAQKEYREKCLSVGFTEFLTKPIDQPSLYKVLARCLNLEVGTKEQNEYLVSSLNETDPDIINLIEKFVIALPGMVSRIQQAAEEKSWGLLADLIHELIGVSGNYGFESIVDLGRDVEQHIRNQQYTDISRHIEQLKILQSRVVVSMDNNLDNSKSA